jgi:hypothetical protein
MLSLWYALTLFRSLSLLASRGSRTELIRSPPLLSPFPALDRPLSPLELSMLSPPLLPPLPPYLQQPPLTLPPLPSPKPPRPNPKSSRPSSNTLTPTPSASTRTSLAVSSSCRRRGGTRSWTGRGRSLALRVSLVVSLSFALDLLSCGEGGSNSRREADPFLHNPDCSERVPLGPYLASAQGDDLGAA